MLGVIRPSTYQANMRPLQSDFYDFSEREDELAASLIAKNIRRLLRRAPGLIAEKNEIGDMNGRSLSDGSPLEGEKWLPHTMAQEKEEERLFHSDSSLSSNCSSLSSNSSFGSSSSSFSSSSSLSQSTKIRKKRNEERSVEVVLPADMMNRLVRDIVRMAEKEINGIRGCQLQIELEDSETGAAVNVGKINCDPKIPRQCLLRVRLVSIPPPPEAHGSQVLLNRLLGSTSYNLYIKPGYTIEKRKLKDNSRKEFR